MSMIPKIKKRPLAERADNFRKAIEIVESVPVKQFDLDVFCSTNKGLWVGCGSIGCTMGWLASHAYFKQRGLILEQRDVVFYPPNVDLKNNGIHDPQIAAKVLFGGNGWDKYFTGYGNGKWDHKLIQELGLTYPTRDNVDPPGKDHKALALARLKKGLKDLH